MSSAPRVVVLLSLLLWGCTSEIGDECANSSECTQTEADRLCLTESLEGFPGGYCTSFNCEPGSCSEEAVCVAYRATLANAEACSDPLDRARLQRSYCMRNCSSDSDCRGGYACLDLSGDNPWGATVLERGAKAQQKVCAVAYSEPEDLPERQSAVCEWSTPPELQLDAGGAQTGGPAPGDASAQTDASARSDASASTDAAAPVDATTPLDAALDGADAAISLDAATPIEAAAPADAAAMEAAAPVTAPLSADAASDAAADAARR